MERVGRFNLAAAAIAAQRKALRRRVEEMRRTAYARGLERSPFAVALREGSVELQWATGKLFSDPPDKLRRPPDLSDTYYLGPHLTPHADAVRTEMLVASAYLVPAGRGVDWFGDMVDRGVSVRILTNSLAATDVWLVHAGYRKYRRGLVERGVEIHELKPHGRKGHGARNKKKMGSSRASLHAKTIVLDRSSVFVGSLNIDPRSLTQNTEAGVLVESPGLAREVARRFDRWTDPSLAYRVELAEGPDGHDLRWVGVEDGVPVRLEDEPHAGFLRRWAARALSRLPIEYQV
jgi:putative cardiolipin synthase